MKIKIFNVWLTKETTLSDFSELKDSFHILKGKDGKERFITKNLVEILNELFCVELVFINGKLSRFILQSGKFEYEDAYKMHVAWLEKNFGIYRNCNDQFTYTTEEYKFYTYYDPRSGSSEIIVDFI